MTMEKTYKSAIIIAPPTSICQQIQKIRIEHDAAYDRWMPHINLIYPYYEDRNDCFKKEARKIFKHISVQMQPFVIEFTRESIGCFIHGRRFVLWIKPLVSLQQKTNNEILTKCIIPSKESFTDDTPTKMSEKEKKKPKSNHTVTLNDFLPTYMQQTTVIKKKKNIKVITENTSEAEVISGIDALRYAFWTPENTSETIVIRENCADSGFDALRYAFEGLSPKRPKRDLIKVAENIGVVRREEDELFDDQDSSSSDSSDSESTESESESESDDDEIETGSSVEDDATIMSPRKDGHHPNVMYLQNELEKIYPDMLDLSTKSDEGFQPHLTLGQFSIGFGTKFMEKLKQEWKPVKFLCNEICLISRKGQSDPFKVIERVPIGGMKNDVSD